MNPLQARMTFAMARQVVLEMARSSGVRARSHVGGGRLQHAEFQALGVELRASGLRWDDAATEENLTALRATYEPMVEGLSVALLMPLPGWLPKSGDIDHWQKGHRGQVASRLIQQLIERDSIPANATRKPLSTKLRERWRKRPS